MFSIYPFLQPFIHALEQALPQSQAGRDFIFSETQYQFNAVEQYIVDKI